MFGKKKVLKTSSRSISTDNDLNNSHSGDDSKFIYYAKSDRFISQLEIYVKPNNYPEKKVLVIINNEADFSDLYSQIKDSFKAISEFKNVAGLRVENLHKLKNEIRFNLPKSGCINGYLKSGDIIYCDIVSDEFWIKTYFKITSYNYKKVVKLEYKIQKKMKFKYIKYFLLKAGIELFWDELKKNNLDTTFNYFVKEIKFHNKKSKKAQNIFETIDFTKKLKYLDVKNEIMINLNFGIFEELVHQQLISTNFQKSEANYYRLNEYCNLAFEEILVSKKFEAELGTVKEISQDFLTSQYNDVKTPFLFYNIKKKETAEEFMYNMINMSNSYEPEVEDDEEDDAFEFEGDTSFGKFYAEDASKFFGNITSIKKTKNKYLKRHNKYDSNMIIIAPFLFKLITINNKKILINKNNNDKNANVFRTFAHQNLKENNTRKRKEEDLNNFFISPLSLGTNDNNILKDDNNHILYNVNGNDNDNDFDNENNDLILDEKQQDILNNKIDEENLNDIFDLDNVYQKTNKNKRYTVKLDDVMSQKSNRKSIFEIMRLSRQSNCCNDLFNSFSQIDFINNLKIKYKNYISKKVIDTIKIPESRDYENIDKDFLIFLKKKESEEDNSLIVKNKKLIIFLFIFFIYYALMIIAINIDALNMFYFK